MKTVIHIFGASGSGTSTLGSAVAERSGLTWLDTDSYIWQPTDPPFVTLRDKSERLMLLSRDIDCSDGAVVSGSLCGWGDPLIDRFSLTVRLVVPTSIRLERLTNREYSRFGERIREGGDMYKTHIDFIEWASKYDSGGSDMRSKAEHDLWQQKLTCPLLVLDGTLPLEALVETVLNSL